MDAELVSVSKRQQHKRQLKNAPNWNVNHASTDLKWTKTAASPVNAQKSMCVHCPSLLVRVRHSFQDTSSTRKPESAVASFMEDVEAMATISGHVNSASSNVWCKHLPSQQSMQLGTRSLEPKFNLIQFLLETWVLGKTLQTLLVFRARENNKQSNKTIVCRSEYSRERVEIRQIILIQFDLF